jgi:recombination protein RecA
MTLSLSAYQTRSRQVIQNKARRNVAKSDAAKGDMTKVGKVGMAKGDSAKEQALAAALSQIERQFGKGSMMRLGDREQVNIPSISTGSLGLDIALGIGGLPRGRVVEIYGPESSGKTTLTLQAIAEAQKGGGTCAFIDAEHALDPIYAEALGVNTDELLVSQPDTGEQALEICDMIVRSGAVALVVIDSVAALTPKAEIEGEMGDSHVGLQARLMSQALRKMTANIKNSNTTVMFINQIRMKIGVMFGSPETTTGGNALKFYSSVRLDIRRIGAVKDADEVIGNETRVKVVKNKVAPPFRQAEFEILYGTGINRLGEIIELGVKQGIVEKSGAWYSYKSDRIGQGRKKSAEFLEANPAIAEEIESAIRAQLMPDRDADPSSDPRKEAAPETEVDAATASTIDVELPARSSGPSSAASGPSSAEGTA